MALSPTHLIKVCGVCGDKALGFNFNAVTCESCKAFFRRNALTLKQFNCPFNNDCEITVVKRRFCQKCRLEKCFSIGMKKEHIMTDEDKELKRKKIEQNRAKKQRILNNDVNYREKSDSDSMGETDSSIMSEMIGNDIIRQNQTNNYTDRIYDTLKLTREALQEDKKGSVEPNSIESILCEAIKLEFEAYSSIAPQYINNSRELNDAERAKLNELIVANKALMQPVDDDINMFLEDQEFLIDHSIDPTEIKEEKNPKLIDVINLTAIAIRRLIKMAKKINAFKNMCQEDQVALLKGGCTEMMLLRSVMTYDPQRNSWKLPLRKTEGTLTQIKTEVLKEAKGNIYEEHERFIKTFDTKWRMDENIILIMCAITLFTPDRARVIHQDVIKLEQNSYYYLLRRYLESIYQGCEAKSTFLKLIQKISELHRLHGEVINVYLNVNPSDIEPLLIELFDLKPH